MNNNNVRVIERANPINGSLLYIVQVPDFNTYTGFQQQQTGRYDVRTRWIDYSEHSNIIEANNAKKRYIDNVGPNERLVG